MELGGIGWNLVELSGIEWVRWIARLAGDYS